MALKNQIQSLMKGSLSIHEYVEQKRTIADDLSENLHPISNEDLVGHILNGLDSSYGPFVTPFMMRTEDVDVTLLYLAGLNLVTSFCVHNNDNRENICLSYYLRPEILFLF